MTPYLFRFAQPIPGAPLPLLRYDVARQLSQVLIDGAWTDAADYNGDVARYTRMTRAKPETTDDE